MCQNGDSHGNWERGGLRIGVRERKRVGICQSHSQPSTCHKTVSTQFKCVFLVINLPLVVNEACFFFFWQDFEDDDCGAGVGGMWQNSSSSSGGGGNASSQCNNHQWTPPTPTPGAAASLNHESSNVESEEFSHSRPSAPTTTSFADFADHQVSNKSYLQTFWP